MTKFVIIIVIIFAIFWSLNSHFSQLNLKNKFINIFRLNDELLRMSEVKSSEIIILSTGDE